MAQTWETGSGADLGQRAAHPSGERGTAFWGCRDVEDYGASAPKGANKPVRAAVCHSLVFRRVGQGISRAEGMLV